MVAPATLSLRPCPGLAPPHPIPSSFHFPTNRPPLLFPPRSHHLHNSSRAQPPLLRTTLPLTRAIAIDSNQPGSPHLAAEQEGGPRRYYFLVANAKFMLDEEEHFQELLFERLRNYAERNKEQDFWLVVEPKFLDKFPNVGKRLRRPAVALVSTDSTWITYMKLRLDRVLEDNFEADSLDEALASNPVDLQFEKPEKWVAPYPKYESGWWKPFLPPEASITAA